MTATMIGYQVKQEKSLASRGLHLNVPQREQVRPKCDGERSGGSWEKAFCFVFLFPYKPVSSIFHGT